MFKIFIIGSTFKDLTDAILNVIGDSGEDRSKTSIFVIEPLSVCLPENCKLPFMIVAGTNEPTTRDIAGVLKRRFAIEVYSVTLQQAT